MMWELITANKKKSMALFLAMGLFLMVLGYVLGEAIYRGGGGMTGLFVALGIYGFLAVVSVFAGDSVLLASSRAKEITKDMHPRLFNVVEEMKIASGLPVMPRIFIVEDPAPNAFAAGTKPEKSSIAVTTGLLSRLNRDELQGVVAHEVSHIMNRDVQFITYAGIMLGSIVLISEIFLRYLWFAPRSSRRSRVAGGGQAQILILVGAIALAILAPVFARLLYFAISRKREFLADASAARLTRYPEGLASALEKIATTAVKSTSANKVTAPMYIADPFRKGGSSLSSLTSTHPPIEERIKVLRTMAGGAGLINYQRAFSKVKGKPTMIIPGSGLKDESVPVRKPSPEPEAAPKRSVREAIDLLRAAHGYAFVLCACGLKIKLPPDYEEPRVRCPRCGRLNEIPLALAAMMGGALAPSGVAEEGQEPSKRARGKHLQPLHYQRKGKGWETFACSCGKLIQLSPAFCAKTVTCRHCGRIIEVAEP